ncbi:MAG: FxsA family protein, partial [Candidatus Paceibacterales bacterium]
MPLILFFGFPFVEIYLLVKAGEIFGYGNLLFFLVLKGFFGLTLMRLGAQGVSLDASQTNLQRPVSTKVAMGIGGLLLMIPGLITSSIGLLILLRPTRFILGYFLKSAVAAGFKSGGVRVFNFQSGFGGPFGPEGHNSQKRTYPNEFAETVERDVSPQ